MYIYVYIYIYVLSCWLEGSRYGAGVSNQNRELKSYKEICEGMVMLKGAGHLVLG